MALERTNFRGWKYALWSELFDHYLEDALFWNEFNEDAYFRLGFSCHDDFSRVCFSCFDRNCCNAFDRSSFRDAYLYLRNGR